jgi:hypothetical protein
MDSSNMQPAQQTHGSTGWPLCLNQEQLLLSREWIQRQGDAMSPSLTPIMLALRGSLNEGALERALNGMVRRHSALRVRIYPAPEVTMVERDARLRAFARGIYTPGLYQQSVCEHADLAMRRVDLTALPQAFAKEEVQNLFYEEATCPFDYANPPLLRASLVRLGAEDHLLILVVDQAVTDGWSLRILRNELALLYEHFCTGSPHQLPDPALQYPDYAVWQKEARNGSHFDAATSYWKQQWTRYGAARIALGELPFALPVEATSRVSFGLEESSLDPEMCRQIRSFTRQFRATLNVFFLAAYAVVLQSYTRKPQLGIWSHFSNRGRAEIQNTVGYFVHTHLLGIDFSSDPTGAELLEQVRQTILNGYDHQEMPLPHLWQQMNCWPRYADARVLVDHHHAEETWENQPQLSGLTIRRAKPPELLQGRFSNLGVYIKSSADGMSLSVQYAQERFPQAAIRDLLEDLHTVMAGLLADPRRKAAGLLEKHRYAASLVRPMAPMGEFVRLAADLAESWRVTEPKLAAVWDKPSI